MAGINKVILVGKLGKDPESKSFPNGGSVVQFSLATSETWKDKQSGERKEKTEWHNIVIRNENIGRVAMQYLRKGSEAYIEGTLSTRKWQDQSGTDRYTTEVIVGPFKGELTLLGGKAGKSDGYSDGEYAAPSRGGAGSFPQDDLNDDVPF